jgi:hypothetical protein
MKPPLLLLIVSLACQVSFSQTADSVQEIDLCRNFQSIRSVALPLKPTDENYKRVRLSVASIKAINKATLLSLSEGESECIDISGEVDDENFKNDFDTLERETYSIVRISPAKPINNQLLLFVLTTEKRGHTYLITFNRTGSRNNCMQARSAVLLDLIIGNNHFSHSRVSTFINYNTIQIEGSCWHENDVPLVEKKRSVMLTIQKDGTIVMKEADAQASRNYEDSLQIVQYTKQLNRELVKESAEEGNTIYTDEIIDSILSSNRMGFGGGKVHYAPDSAFKIYIINGNGGAPYGNEVYESYLHFKDGKRLDMDDDFDPVAAIYKTGAFTYLVIQHYWSRSSSSHAEVYYTLTQFSVEKDSIQYHAIQGTNKWPLYYTYNDKDFTIYTYHVYENAEKTYMRYNPKTKKLNYSFMIGREQADGRYDDLFPVNKNENQALQVTGTCVVKNGLLQFAGEKFNIVAWKSATE